MIQIMFNTFNQPLNGLRVAIRVLTKEKIMQQATIKEFFATFAFIGSMLSMMIWGLIC